jgi:hypothetical protein
MIAVASLAVIAVASTSALVTLALTRGGLDQRVVSAAIPQPVQTVTAVTPTRPTPQVASAKATPMETVTPPVKAVSSEPVTAVKITRWGSPKTQPRETVDLVDPTACTTSNLLTREDALRCFTTTDSGASIVNDPCFALDTGEGLMCPVAPWSAGWIQIAAQGNSGATNPPTTKGPPWGVEIAGGVRCTGNSGAVSSISGLPHRYSCSDGSGLYGDPSRGATWHIKLSSGGSLHSVALQKVWF